MEVLMKAVPLRVIYTKATLFRDWGKSMEVDSRELRNAFGRFATGVTVVTWQGDDGKPHGVTVNSFTSVSLDPPLVLISMGQSAKSHDALHNRAFTVHVLSADQESLAWQFAGRPQPNLQIEWEGSPSMPRLKHALATFECSPWREYDGGDHTIFIGEVTKFSYTEDDALLFYQGKFLQTDCLKQQV